MEIKSINYELTQGSWILTVQTDSKLTFLRITKEQAILFYELGVPDLTPASHESMIPESQKLFY